MDEFEHIENEGNRDRNEILSKSIRCGKRTYFFDLKISRRNELYVTITESKRRFDETNGNFFYEKHKLFLLEQDLESFHSEMSEMIEFIKANPHLANLEQNKNSDFKPENE
jgi:hypothetical protein